MKRNISPIGLTLHPRVRILLSEQAKSRHSRYTAEVLGPAVMVMRFHEGFARANGGGQRRTVSRFSTR